LPRGKGEAITRKELLLPNFYFLFFSFLFAFYPFIFLFTPIFPPLEV
jgi:hypothetical protein